SERALVCCQTATFHRAFLRLEAGDCRYRGFRWKLESPRSQGGCFECPSAPPYLPSDCDEKVPRRTCDASPAYSASRKRSVSQLKARMAPCAVFATLLCDQRQHPFEQRIRQVQVIHMALNRALESNVFDSISAFPLSARCGLIKHICEAGATFAAVKFYFGFLCSVISRESCSLSSS